MHSWNNKISVFNIKDRYQKHANKLLLPLSDFPFTARSFCFNFIILCNLSYWFFICCCRHFLQSLWFASYFLCVTQYKKSVAFLYLFIFYCLVTFLELSCIFCYLNFFDLIFSSLSSRLVWFAFQLVFFLCTPCLVFFKLYYLFISLFETGRYFTLRFTLPFPVVRSTHWTYGTIYSLCP